MSNGASLIGVRRAKYSADQGRFVVPQEFRDGLGTDVRLMLNDEHTGLFVLPAPRFEELARRARETQAEGTTVFARPGYKDTAGGFMAPGKVDGRHRLTIPDDLADLVEFGEEVALMGLIDRVEIIPVEELEERKRLVRQSRQNRSAANESANTEA